MSELKGFKELNRKLNQLEAKVADKVVRKGAAKMAQVVRKEMRRNAPSKRSGYLHKNLRYRITRMRNGGFSAKVGAFNKAYYALFLERGTRSHRIPKRGSKPLVIGGQVVKNIQHPGTKARPFIKRSLMSARTQAIREAGLVMFKEIKKIV